MKYAKVTELHKPWDLIQDRIRGYLERSHAAAQCGISGTQGTTYRHGRCLSGNTYLWLAGNEAMEKRKLP